MLTLTDGHLPYHDDGAPPAGRHHLHDVDAGGEDAVAQPSQHPGIRSQAGQVAVVLGEL